MITGTALFFGLFNNLAIFIILVAVYGVLDDRLRSARPVKRAMAMGVSFGLFAIACMYVKIPVAEGVIVDQRNAIVTLSGIFGGPLAAVICGIMAGALRIYYGGAGTLAGACGIGLAAAAGSGIFYLRHKIDSPIKAILTGAAAVVIILPGFLLVGDMATGWHLMMAMALPYGSAIFIGISFVGLLLAHEEHRNKTKQALVASEQSFRKIFENLIDVSYQTDREGNFLVVSPSSEKLFGYTPEEVIGRQIANFYKDPGKREEFLTQLMKDGQVDNFEAEIRKKDGSFVWVSTNAKMVTDEAGAFAGVEGVTRDISATKAAKKERERLEESLRQSQKMEAVGTLAGGIAHDFNNILSAIVGYTELANANLKKGSKEGQYLDQVLQAAQRAKELTMQILTFSRKGQPNKERILIHLIIEEVAKLLVQTIPVTVKIITDIDRTTGTIVADPIHIHQIALNLCTNAYHAFKNETGEITIRLTAETVDDTNAEHHQNLPPGRYALLTVSDNGTGIDQETLPRIFEPFFTTKEQGKGTGMGLSVVHGIVQDHGGAVSVESAPGRGSTFRVYLPLAENRSDKVDQHPLLDLPQGQETILLVDDEPHLVTIGKTMLEKLGYSVVATTSAQEALAIFKEDSEAFDLIITDQTMPEIPGDVVVRRARAIRPTIPVVLCTGHSSIMDADKARTIGVQAFLMKPLNISTLSNAVRQVLDNPQVS